MKVTTASLVLAREGEQLSGDAVFVREDDRGRTLLALVDALGHGPEAHAVASVAVKTLASVSLADGIAAIVTQVARALDGGRGAAAMFCLLEEGWLRGCGVGNVQLCASGVPVVLSEGVLGGRVRKLRPFEGRLKPKGRLVLFSDGLSTRVAADPVADAIPSDVAARLMRDYRYRHDDASVLVADWEHPPR